MARNYRSQPPHWHRYGMDILSRAGFPQDWNTGFGKEFTDYMDRVATSDKQIHAIIRFYRENNLDLGVRSLLRSTSSMAAYSFIIRKIGA